MNLKEKALSGIKWTAISSIFSAGAQFLQLVVLAHLLPAKDFGLMALALVVIGFSQIFLDIGVSNAIIQNQNIQKRELDSLYWINILSGFMVFASLFLLAPFFSQFYNEAGLTGIVRWISVGFLIQPFEQQFLVLLKKELQFNAIAKRDIGSKLVNFVVAVVLAVLGFGVYALVFGYLSGVLISTVLILYQGLKFHRPSFYFNFTEIKSSLKFGLFQMGENIINYFNSQFDSILIGRIFGVESLGVYNIAKNIAMRPSQIINPIITQINLPVMAKMQNNIQHLCSAYLKTTNYLSSVNFPVYFFIAAFADPLVSILFGSEWAAAVPILRVLSFYAMIRSTANPIGGLILARGRADLGFYWNLGLFILIPASIYFGSRFGLTCVAGTLVLLQFLLLFPGWRFLVFSCCNAGFREYFIQMLIPFLISLIQGIFYLVVIFLIKQPFLQITVGMIIMLTSGICLNNSFNKVFFAQVTTYTGINRLQFFLKGNIK